MAFDSAGKGIFVGQAAALAGSTIVGTADNGQHMVVQHSDGTKSYTRQQKSSPYTVGSAFTTTGTVVGLTNAGASVVIKEPDGYLMQVPAKSVTVT